VEAQQEEGGRHDRTTRPSHLAPEPAHDQAGRRVYPILAEQVRRWIEAADLKARKIGRHWRIAEHDLALFLATEKAGSLVHRWPADSPEARLSPVGW
jgi:hypothetical protein